jgi:hypothetical protein
VTAHSLRRALGDEFDALYSQGNAFDEKALIAFGFARLDEIAQT